jgi:enoyl-CoA hydratase/carnithine racemase
MLIYRKTDFVGNITLNRPAVGNAIDTQLALELRDVCASIKADDTVRAVTITGAGQHFCVGINSNEASFAIASVARTILDIDQPVIAAINGDALGQGLELALACDLRIAADTAHFSLPQVISGFIPQDGGTQLLPRLVGKGRAMEMILTGEPVDATKAYEIGLVNKIVPLPELMPTVTKIVNEMVFRAPISLRYTKEAVYKGLELTLEQGMHLEADLYSLLQTTEDRTEGIKAFLQRRKAQFKGK